MIKIKNSKNIVSLGFRIVESQEIKRRKLL